MMRTQSYWLRRTSGGAIHLEVVLAPLANVGEKRVVIAHIGAWLRKSSIMVRLGDSRRSSTSFLYATPSTSTRRSVERLLASI